MLSVIKATKNFFEVQRKRRNENLTKEKKIQITKKNISPFFGTPIIFKPNKIFLLFILNDLKC